MSVSGLVILTAHPPVPASGDVRHAPSRAAARVRLARASDGARVERRRSAIVRLFVLLRAAGRVAFRDEPGGRGGPFHELMERAMGKGRSPRRGTDSRPPKQSASPSAGSGPRGGDANPQKAWRRGAATRMMFWMNKGSYWGPHSGSCGCCSGSSAPRSGCTSPGATNPPTEPRPLGGADPKAPTSRSKERGLR